MARVVKDFKEIKGVLTYCPEKLAKSNPENISGEDYYLFEPSKKLILFVDRGTFFKLIDEFVDLYDAKLIEEILLFHGNRYVPYEMPKDIKKFRKKLEERIKRMRAISKLFRSLKADCFGIIFSEDFSKSVLENFKKIWKKDLGYFIIISDNPVNHYIRMVRKSGNVYERDDSCEYPYRPLEEFKKLLALPLKLEHADSFKKIVKLMKECCEILGKEGEVGIILAEILKRLISHLVVNYHKIISDSELKINFKILLVEVIKAGEEIVGEK